HAREAQRAAARRADEPPGPGIDQRAERGAPEVRGDGAARDARSGSAGRSRYPRVALRERAHRGLQGHVRGTHVTDGERVVCTGRRKRAIRSWYLRSLASSEKNGSPATTAPGRRAA